MRRPIENNSSPGQAVYEPFSGSGTTIIAAEMTGPSCHAIELDPVYVDVIRRIIVSPPDREKLRATPGLAISDPEPCGHRQIEGTGWRD